MPQFPEFTLPPLAASPPATDFSEFGPLTGAQTPLALMDQRERQYQIDNGLDAATAEKTLAKIRDQINAQTPLDVMAETERRYRQDAMMRFAQADIDTPAQEAPLAALSQGRINDPQAEIARAEAQRAPITQQSGEVFQGDTGEMPPAAEVAEPPATGGAASGRRATGRTAFYKPRVRRGRL